ncbi:hypothetical protein BDM02DRAFT_3191191 [Thelephora ganbajun]|uniref:Uncharacterized protein n=1 Tax=Thelephora ganbajun TaxID=370292 RepID=A0ACB6Z3E3_THEGA|nr:hypothetical protein BDM02DRAFT_3191191 [Thelephora ganbajun]
MGPGIDWKNPPAEVSDGEGPDFVDYQVKGQTLPVAVDCYSQEYQVELEKDDGDDDKMEEEIMFGYGEESLCTVTVYRIIRKSHPMEEQRQLIPLTSDELVRPKTYRIHQGYHHVLAGFLWETWLLSEGLHEECHCLFCSTYLIKVLDCFAVELSQIPEGAGAAWRSATLHPILQRQLRGVDNHRMLVMKERVGMTYEDTRRFYLLDDPLDPKHIPRILRNLVYNWSVRWSLGHLDEDKDKDDTRLSYRKAIKDTKATWKVLQKIDKNQDGEALYDHEVQMVKDEGIDHYYRYHGLIKDEEGDLTGGEPSELPLEISEVL